MKYFLFCCSILFFCQCKQIKSNDDKQLSGNYIVLEMVCGHFMEQHGAECGTFRQTYKTQIRKFVFDAKDERYKILTNKFRHFKNNSLESMHIYPRIHMEIYQNDTLFYTICIDMNGNARISNNSIVQENDSLISYLYRTFCSPKYDSIFFAR